MSLHLCQRSIGALSFLLVMLVSCGPPPPPPPELLAARQAFQRSTQVPAGRAPLAELEAARQRLEQAEQAYSAEPGSPVTRDLAYLALRQAEWAESLSRLRSGGRELAVLQRRGEEMKARLQRERTERARAVAAEKAKSEAARARVRDAARSKTQRVLDELRQIGELSEGTGALVLRIPARSLFSHRKRELAPDAQPILERLARSLAKLDLATFVVQAHDDQPGSPERARRLTLDEADQVRAALLAAGLAPERVEALGKGKDEPLISKHLQSGARNRRIEIWIKRAPSPEEEEDTYSGLLTR